MSADWPGFHGPDRDNKSKDTGLLKKWPKGGPERLWLAKGIGEGYSTVSIVGGKIFTTGSVKGECVITAFDMDGKKVWTRNNGKAWKGDYPGTRSTPTISKDGLLYHYSGYGRLVCCKTEDGRTVWSMDALRKFGGRNMYWGLSESPLIIDDMVICTVGGVKTGMIALNRKTGELIWKSKGFRGDRPGYGSAILVDYKGLRQIVIPTSKSIVSVRASDGKTLWQFSHKVMYDENITTALFQDGCLIVAGSIRKGTTCLKLHVTGKTSKVSPKWVTKILDNKQGGMVLVNDRLYGFSETLVKSKPWMCLNFKDGKVVFADNPVKTSYKYGNGSLTWADGMFYLFSDDGHLALAKAGDSGYDITGEIFLKDPGKRPTWAHPVVHGGRLYIRYGDKLGVYNVSAK